jgi:hypothetical protein
MWLDHLYFLTIFAVAAPILVFFGLHPDDGWIWFGTLVALAVVASYPNGVGWGFSSTDEAKEAFRNLFVGATLAYLVTFGILISDHAIGFRKLLSE